jgi:hypothetical protein
MPNDYTSAPPQYDLPSVTAPLGASELTPWDGQTNIEKFNSLNNRLQYIENEFYRLQNSFRQHSHAPSGKVVVEY